MRGTGGPEAAPQGLPRFRGFGKFGPFALDTVAHRRWEGYMSLVARAKAILLSPKTEWGVIDAEQATVGSLYIGYIMPLAAIPAVASFIGLGVVGISGYRWGMVSALTMAVTSYVGALVGTFVLALIVDALAPTFGGQKNQIQALKVAAYSSTASWMAGIFSLIPALSWLAILGLYSLYLLFLGLPRLMKAPQEKAAGYTVVAIICAIVVYAVLAWITAMVVPRPGLGVLPGMMP
jgi:hypothetical protein